VKTIDLNSDWRIEHFEPHDGLARKAYRQDYTPDGEALTVDLPRTAQATLVDHGVAADPCVGRNSDDLKWPEQKEWWYYHDFQTPDHHRDQRVVLKLDGITYRADLWINGQTLGHIEGMFRTDRFDITDRLDATGPNRLAIRVRTQEDAHHDDRGSDVRHHVRSQGVVMQAMSRWNWCPHLVAVGVWQPVWLEVRDAVEIESVCVRTVSVETASDESTIPDTAPAEIDLTWTLSNQSDRAQTVTLGYEMEGDTFEDFHKRDELNATVPANGSIQVKHRVSLPKARLWWSNGLGRAALYRLRSTIDQAPGDPHESTFGVRQIEWVENDDASWVTQVSGHSARPWTMIEPLYPWVLKLNGRRVFLKGSNWVHADVLLRLERSRYEKLLQPAEHGGLNFLRVWGGSLAETDDFYDLCDRMGILCWQEFWLACANYPALDRALLERCARDTVRRLMNHPSLVFYSGGNEFEPDNNENRSAVDTLARVVEQEDPHRGFRRGSPYKGDKHGGLIPTPTTMRNKYLDILPGDRRQVLFRSETAVGRSAPMFASLDRFLSDSWPLDEAEFRHFFGVPSEFLGFANEYAADDNFFYATLANHMAHARVLQVNLEYCRAQMFRCGGHLNWQYSVPWPCLHREIVDWWGIPKPAFYGYANTCRDPAVFIDFERYLWHPGETMNPAVHLVNDHLRLEGLRCIVEVFDTAGQRQHAQQWGADSDANTSQQLGALNWSVPDALAGASLLLFARIERDGHPLFQTAYWVAVSLHRHDPDALSLAGPWQRDDGSTLQLPGNDMQRSDDGFESIVSKSQERDFEQTAEDRSEAVAHTAAVTYRRTFELPEKLHDQPLELFCLGIESGYEVRINGQTVVQSDFRRPTLDLAAMAYVPHGQDQTDARIDPDTDYPFFSDPITLPKLTPCFADVPAELLNPGGENSIELRIDSDVQKVIAHPLVLRRVTSNREAVTEHLRRGRLFEQLRNMPGADVTLQEHDGRVTVHNRGPVVAVMVLLDVSSSVETGNEMIPTSDNSLMLRPGEQRTIERLGGGPLPRPGHVTLRGWNVEPTELNWT